MQKHRSSKPQRNKTKLPRRGCEALPCRRSATSLGRRLLLFMSGASVRKSRSRVEQRGICFPTALYLLCETRQVISFGSRHKAYATQLQIRVQIFLQSGQESRPIPAQLLLKTPIRHFQERCTCQN